LLLFCQRANVILALTTPLYGNGNDKGKGKGNFYYELLISNALRYGSLVNERSNSFTCHTHAYPQLE